MDNKDLIKYIEKIIKTKEPTKIISYELDLGDEIKYSDLVKHWKEEKDDKITKEYTMIKDFNLQNTIGLFSMFYLKGKPNFLTVGKFKNDMFHLDIKCNQYSDILNMVMESDNSIFVLSYWIL